MKKFIFTNNTKTFKTILIVLLSVVFLSSLVISCFIIDSLAVANPKAYHKFVLSTFNGSYDKEGLPSTYWQVDAYDGDNIVSAKMDLPIKNQSENYLGQIWINISDLPDNKLEIKTYYGNKNKLNKDDVPFVITRNDLKNSEDGWFKVYDYKDTERFNKARSYVINYTVSFSTEVRVRSMVFIDTSGNMVTGIKEISEYLNEQIDPSSSVLNAVDETSLFDMKKVNS